jgi:NAD(P)-dependent dehydrogenase (short-subunit alcohol dehydrogenase family)
MGARGDEQGLRARSCGARHPLEHDRADLHRNADDRPFFEDEAFKASVLAKIKLGRLGQVEDLMGAVLYLALRCISALVTGTSLIVDGGWTADYCWSSRS